MPSRLVPILGGATVVVLALPVFALAGWPLAGWALGAVLWAGSQVLGLVLTLRGRRVISPPQAWWGSG